MDESAQTAPTVSEKIKDTHQYCGGCGHIYFSLPMVTKEEAKENSVFIRCESCIEEGSEDQC
jgi:hypothetical protein